MLSTFAQYQTNKGFAVDPQTLLSLKYMDKVADIAKAIAVCQNWIASLSGPSTVGMVFQCLMAISEHLQIPVVVDEVQASIIMITFFVVD